MVNVHKDNSKKKLTSSFKRVNKFFSMSDDTAEFNILVTRDQKEISTLLEYGKHVTTG